MTALERKVDALVRLAVTDDLCRQAQIREELKKLLVDVRPIGTVEEEIEALLQELCYPVHMRGYRYTMVCVRLCVENPGLMDALHKGVYAAACGVIKGTTVSRLERCIRAGVNNMHDNCDPAVLERYFAGCINRNGLLSTGTFLRRMVKTVRQRMGMEVMVC